MNTRSYGKFRQGGHRGLDPATQVGFNGTMPIYFAYGSNLDRIGMRRRCPGAIPLGIGRCPGYGFFIMADGYASIRPETGGAVHGLLWSVPDHDVLALDAYEEVESGLYRKAVVSVDQPDGVRTDALIYIGGSETVGDARPGYMELVMAAAVEIGLPPGYCAKLARWLPPKGGGRER